MDAGKSITIKPLNECLPVNHVLPNTPAPVLLQLLLQPMVAQLYICMIDFVQR